MGWEDDWTKESLTTTQEKPKDRLDQLVDQYNAAVRKYEQETSPEQKRKDLKEFRKQRRKSKTSEPSLSMDLASLGFLGWVIQGSFTAYLLVLLQLTCWKRIIGVFITWDSR